MQQRSEETRNHILEAGHRLFSKEGYDACGVAEICQAAGVSKGAFYHHFPSKQTVFLALMDVWMGGLETGFSLMRQQTHNVPDAMLSMAEMIGSVYQAADVRMSIILEFWTQAFRDPEIWQAAISPYRRYQAYFTELIREGMAEGSLAAADPELAGRTLVALAMGLLLQALFDPQAADWQHEPRHCVELLLKGLSRKEQP